MSCELELVVEVLQQDTETNITTVCEEIILVVEDNPCSGGGSVEVSPQPDNQLQKLPDGLYVPPTVASWASNDW